MYKDSVTSKLLATSLTFSTLLYLCLTEVTATMLGGIPNGIPRVNPGDNPTVNPRGIPNIVLTSPSAISPLQELHTKGRSLFATHKDKLVIELEHAPEKSNLLFVTLRKDTSAEPALPLASMPGSQRVKGDQHPDGPGPVVAMEPAPELESASPSASKNATLDPAQQVLLAAAEIRKLQGLPAISGSGANFSLYTVVEENNTASSVGTTQPDHAEIFFAASSPYQPDADAFEPVTTTAVDEPANRTAIFFAASAPYQPDADAFEPVTSTAVNDPTDRKVIFFAASSPYQPDADAFEPAMSTAVDEPTDRTVVFFAASSPYQPDVDAFEPDSTSIAVAQQKAETPALLVSKSFASQLSADDRSDYEFELFTFSLEASSSTQSRQLWSSRKQPSLLDTTPTDESSRSETFADGNIYSRELPGLLSDQQVEPLVIVLDPGHGGSDPGTIGNSGALEKELTLDVAKRASALAGLHNDLKIVLTREDDTGLSRAGRLNRVATANADLLVSLHFNHLPQGNVTLVETYYMTAEDKANRLHSEAKPDEDHHHHNHGDKARPHRVTSATSNIANAVSASGNGVSENLARFLQSEVFDTVQSQNPKAIDAGIKRESFYLLAGSAIPGALIELTCLSNPEEEARLQSEQYRDELAESLVNGLRKFIDSELIASAI